MHTKHYICKFLIYVVTLLYLEILIMHPSEAVAAVNLMHENVFYGSESKLKLSLPDKWVKEMSSERDSNIYKSYIWNQSFEKENLDITVELWDFYDEKYQEILEGCGSQDKVLEKVTATLFDEEESYLKEKGVELHHDAPMKTKYGQTLTLGIRGYFKYEGEEINRIYVCQMHGSNFWAVICMTRKGDKRAEEICSKIISWDSIRVSGSGMSSPNINNIGGDTNTNSSSGAYNSDGYNYEKIKKESKRINNKELGIGIIVFGVLVLMAGFFFKKRWHR